MKYWAVKEPKEHKGVYSKKAIISEKQKLLSGTKGLVVKSFNTNKGSSLEEALNWAGVSGIADGDSMPLSNTNKTTSKSVVTQKKCELELLIDGLRKEGHEIITILLSNGYKCELTLKDVWYDTHTFNNRKHTKQVYDNEQRKYIYIWDKEHLKKELIYLKCLKKSEIIYGEKFITVKGHTAPKAERFNISSYQTGYLFEINRSPLIFNIDQIIKIYPSGYWTFNVDNGYENDVRNYRHEPALLKVLLELKKEVEKSS